MPPKKDHVGERHGYLEVIAEAPPVADGLSRHASTCWWVLCHNCGQKKIMRWQNIIRAQSCGCINANTKKIDRVCAQCGAHFSGNRTTVYCPACREKAREERGVKGSSLVKIPMKCELCGRPFEAGSVTAKYCPECRKIAHRKSNLTGYYRAKSGTARKIGEVYTCAACGKPFALASGYQKYCPACEEELRVRSWQDFREKNPDK